MFPKLMGPPDDDRGDYQEQFIAPLPIPDGKDAFVFLSAKFRQVINQGVPGFAEFLLSLTV